MRRPPASHAKPPLHRSTNLHSVGERTDPGLLRMYASWAQELRAKHERISDLFRHAPSIGRSRELYLAEVLRRALPAHLVLRHGAFYVPGHGASSEQDLLVVDTRKLAPIEEIGDFGVYYRDSVRACIEVKSTLTKRVLRSALDSMVTTKIVGPGLGTKHVLFAYRSPLSPQQLLDAIDNTVEFFDNRIYPIIVLGQYVATISDLQPKKPRPQFTLTVFRPKDLDLTLLDLIDTLFEVSGESPLQGLSGQIQDQFEAVASRVFVCPEERPGTGLGTNLDR